MNSADLAAASAIGKKEHVDFSEEANHRHGSFAKEEHLERIFLNFERRKLEKSSSSFSKLSWSWDRRFSPAAAEFNPKIFFFEAN